MHFVEYLMHRIQEVSKYNHWKFREILTIPEIIILGTSRKWPVLAFISRLQVAKKTLKKNSVSGRQSGSIYMHFVDHRQFREKKF